MLHWPRLKLKRTDFQNLAALRLKEARALLEASCYEGAYYLAGYAAECALKACIAKQTARHEFPEKEWAIACYTHKLSELAKLAGLDKALKAAEHTHPELIWNWNLVRNWSEASRYERPSSADAEELVKALEERKHGVLRWLRRYW